MTQTLDLNKMGLAPLSDSEMEQTNGGGLLDVALLAAGLVIAAVYDLGKAYGTKLAQQGY